jgi:ABC-type transporter Mla MlaB component
VTVRISVTTSQSALHRRIRVAGRLTAEAVGELEGMIGDDLDSVVLDLEDLSALDTGALAALRRLRVAGVAMEGVSPHLAWQIEEEP